jgi:hypothetical protein
VKTPVIFEIIRGEGDTRQTRMVAAHKQMTTGALRLGTYFTTSWQEVDAARAPLPRAINLPMLYTALLEPLLPVAARPGEEMSELTARLEAVRRLDREIDALERKIRNEPQLNRKVELHRVLRTKQASLAAVTSQTKSPAAGAKN